VSEQPWDSDAEREAVLAAERDPDPDDAPVVADESEDLPADEPSAEATGITSHIFTREGARAWSKSTFRVPATTDGVWTRVAFYDGNGARLVLSRWLNKGSANPYQTVIQSWYFDDARARRALVLWSMNGDTWHSWAPR
jgi:hypothetical protein